MAIGDARTVGEGNFYENKRQGDYAGLPRPVEMRIIFKKLH